MIFLGLLGDNYTQNCHWGWGGGGKLSVLRCRKTRFATIRPTIYSRALLAGTGLGP